MLLDSACPISIRFHENEKLLRERFGVCTGSLESIEQEMQNQAILMIVSII